MVASEDRRKIQEIKARTEKKVAIAKRLSRMRVDGWPNFLKTEARSAEKYEPVGEEPYGIRRR